MNNGPKGQKRVVLLLGAISIILGISLILTTVTLLNLKISILENENRIRELESKVEELRIENEKLNDVLSSSNSTILLLKEENMRLKSELTNISKVLNETARERYELLKKISLLEKELNKTGYQDWIYISAVSDGQGVTLIMQGEIRGGSGRLLADVEGAMLGTDFQKSMKTALKVAEEVTGEKLNSKDILIKIKSEKEIIVNGESAGASLAVLMIGLIKGEQLNKSVIVTGILTGTGKILDVSSVRQKTLAAREVAEIMLVPKGQRVYVPGIEVIEVSTIYDVLKYYLDMS